jgi:hypothetical protein
MAQKQMLRAELYARAFRASQDVERAEVRVAPRCSSQLPLQNDHEELAFFSGASSTNMLISLYPYN